MAQNPSTIGIKNLSNEPSKDSKVRRRNQALVSSFNFLKPKSDELFYMLIFNNHLLRTNGGRYRWLLLIFPIITKRVFTNANFTSPQAAKYLGVNRQCFVQARMRSESPVFIKYGKSRNSPVRYDKADLDAWLNKRKFESTQMPPTVIPDIRLSK